MYKNHQSNKLAKGLLYLPLNVFSPQSIYN